VIPIQNTPAFTGVQSVSEPLGHDGPALATCLGGISGIDRNDMHASFFRFAVQVLQERTPAHVSHAFGQVGTSESFDVESFVSNQVKSVAQISCKLAVKIRALISNLSMNAGDSISRSMSRVASTLFSRKNLLRSSERFLSASKVSRVFDRLPAAEDGEFLEAQINTGCFGNGPFGRSISNIANDSNVPPVFARLVPYFHVAHFPAHETVLTKAYATHLGDTHVARSALALGGLDRGTADAKRVISTPRSKPRMTWSLPRFYATKKRLVRTVKSLECRALSVNGDGLEFLFVAKIGQVAALIDVRNAFAPALPGTHTLLQGRVVDLATLPLPPMQLGSLLRKRSQWECKRPNHLELLPIAQDGTSTNF